MSLPKIFELTFEIRPLPAVKVGSRITVKILIQGTSRATRSDLKSRNSSTRSDPYRGSDLEPPKIGTDGEKETAERGSDLVFVNSRSDPVLSKIGN